MSSSRFKIVIACGLAGIVLVALVLFSQRGYGEVSPKTYEFAKALYSICNRRDASRLDDVSKMISESAAAGEMSQTEAGWLQDIVDEARAGEWKTAAGRARRMMEDQVR